MSFKSVIIGLLITVLVLLLVTPVFAQDAPVETAVPTDEPAPIVESMTPSDWILAAVIFGLLAVIVLVLRPLIVQLGASAPAWAVEAGYNAATTLLKEAERRAGLSPSKVDDEIVAELRAEIDRLKKQIDDQAASFLAVASSGN